LLGYRVAARLVEIGAAAAVLSAAVAALFGLFWLIAASRDDWGLAALLLLALYVLALIALGICTAIGWFAYEINGTSSGRGTFGKRIFKLRVSRLDGYPPGSGKSLMRAGAVVAGHAAAVYVSVATGVAPLAFAYVAGELVVTIAGPPGVSIHDYIAGTRVIAATDEPHVEVGAPLG
jgi:uncharacterized RDD family membrane protein YckC